MKNRYLRHFCTLALSEAAEDTLVSIFKTILDWHLVVGKFPGPLQSMATPIISGESQEKKTIMKNLSKLYKLIVVRYFDPEFGFYT